MPFKLTISKLKILLLIDLLIVTFASVGYYYIESSGGSSEFTDLNPTEDVPTEPEQTNPEPQPSPEPEPAEPNPAPEPEPIEPEPTDTTPTEPLPTEPEPTTSEPTTPEPTEPIPTEPEQINPPASDQDIRISLLKIVPNEVWANEPVNLSVIARNWGSNTGRIVLNLTINGKV